MTLQDIDCVDSETVSTGERLDYIRSSRVGAFMYLYFITVEMVWPYNVYLVILVHCEGLLCLLIDLLSVCNSHIS